MSSDINPDVNSDVSKSWFVVLNNPEKHGYKGTPEEICEQLRDKWVQDSTTRTCAIAYCVSGKGLPHVHMVLEDTTSMRFSAIKKNFPKTHIEATKGTKAQAEDYIYKRHPFEEKGEIVVCVVKSGEIKGRQGKRTDLEHIGDLIVAGKTPREILEEGFGTYRYANMIKQAYMDRRIAKTPAVREIKVHYRVGAPGSGKTHYYVDLCAEHGLDNVYLLSDYSGGGFDMYSGESILFLDELKNQFSYSELLSLLQGYRQQIHCRYANVWSLWDEVYITSVLPVEELYKLLVPMNSRVKDPIEQLTRRISDMTYCYVHNGEYRSITIPMTEYHDYNSLQALADCKD